MSYPLLLAAYGKGFITMASLIVAIGVQNAFVLRQGVKGQSSFFAATVCFLCDVLLVTLGVTGLGALFAHSPILNLAIAFVGAAFLLVYALRSFRAAKHAKGLKLDSAGKKSRRNIALTALAVSLLNPHAILDTVVLVGGLAARYEGALRLACTLGALTASAVWFYSLAYGARWLAPFLTRPKVWRMIDCVIGLIMLTIALTLAYDGVALARKTFWG